MFRSGLSVSAVDSNRPLSAARPMSQSHVVADRWKSLDDEDSFGTRPSTRGSRRAGDNRGSDHGARQSQTGTQWDIRDGRCWRVEPVRGYK